MTIERHFDDFLKDHVNLNQTRLDTLNQKVEIITKLLKDKLNDYRTYSPQGSFAHGTIIKPVQDNDEFDADILVFIKDKDFDPNKYTTDYVKIVHDLFKKDSNYKDIVRLKTRCVTIDYASEFSIDIVPCIEHNNDDTYICNRTDKKYEQTDGDGYKKWLSGKNKIASGNYLKKSTRLFKFLRDHKDNFSVKSILLTTMLGDRIDESDKDSNNVSSLPQTFKTLFNRLNDFLQRHPTMPTIGNPALPCEDFNRNWDESKYQNFRNKIKIYTNKVNSAFDEKNHNKSVKKWRELFGDSFGKLTSNKPIGTSIGAGAAAFPTVSATKPYAQ